MDDLMPWPSSLPDYRWPLSATSLGAGPRRLGLAALFHISHAWGRCVSLFFRQRPAVLMIRTDGLGDAVLAEPMMANLARRFPGREFILWGPAATCDLMRECPYVARRMEIPRGYKQGNLEVFRSARWRMRMGYLFGRWKFEVAAYLAQSPEPLGKWVLVSARARERWYSSGNTENQFAEQQARTVKAANKVLSPLPAGHELARNAHLARQWGDDIGGRLPVVFPATTGAAEQWNAWTGAAEKIGASRIAGLVASGMEAMKEYPHRHWAKVAARLWKEERTVLALIGGPGDTANLDRLGSAIGGPHLRMTACMSIPSLAALIGRLDGFFSVDTGLAHIALAQNVRSVILCGGGHPKRFLPWPATRRAVVLNHSMPCEGCMNRCILPTAECVTRIEPERIVEAWMSLSGETRVVAAA
jgi:ADP-heptose:LPS heptosyltransferase